MQDASNTPKTHGGKREGAGRKAPDDSGKRMEIRIYLTPKELAFVESFNKDGVKRSDFLRKIILDALAHSAP